MTNATDLKHIRRAVELAREGARETLLRRFPWLVALAFGLTVLTGVYAFGTISGGHSNPAVTLGAALTRRVEWEGATRLLDRPGAGRLVRRRRRRLVPGRGQ